MKTEQLEKLIEMRKKGMRRYVLVTGVFSYGLPMFIVMTFFLGSDELSARSVAIRAVIWAIGGALFGVAMWYFQAHQLRKADSVADKPEREV